MLSEDDDSGFCCVGCRVVHSLLRRGGLERFYTLRSGPGVPVRHTPRPIAAWAEPLAARVRESESGTRLALDVQGVHCTGCVWLIEELFRRQTDALDVVVNPALGRVDLKVGSGFPLLSWLSDVERFGYTFGPARERRRSASDDTLVRLGITVALAANAMLFSAAIYFGLRTGPLFELFHQLCYAIAAVAVVVGGTPFVRSAWAGIRRGVLHLDTPIALGIVVAFAASSWAFFAGQAGAVYSDSVAVFIALMLAGRYLQERVLERHRRFLLEDQGIDSMLTRRLEGGRVLLAPCRAIREGDELLIAPGDLVPVDSTLESHDASCSLEWIDGESTARTFERGATIVAGAFNVGMHAIEVRSLRGFERSTLQRLLSRDPATQESGGDGGANWWRRVSGAYVAGVLLLGATAFVSWLVVSGEPVRALEVTTAVLVVTCPCALGIATPLAYELALAGLKRHGFFIRRRGFLDRVLAVKRIVFDKTGTLTSGTPRLTDSTPLERLSSGDRGVLYNLVARSGHPKSAAVRRALDDLGADRFDELEVHEVVGSGLWATVDGRCHRLGTAEWALEGRRRDGHGTDELVYAVDGQARARLSTTEDVRPATRNELGELARDGYDIWILSGDRAGRTREVAERVGVAPERALGDLAPEQKASFLAEHDRGDTLMIGDGVNDSLAAAEAHCSGTPAIDRPFMPARTDFYLVTPGLHPIRRALGIARTLRDVVRQNLVFAIAYNAVAVSLALAGWMRPWLAAVLMPASSITVVALTAARLNGRAKAWK